MTRSKDTSPDGQTPIGKLSEATILKTTKWIFAQLKNTLGSAPTAEKRAELIDRLRQHDMANALQEPWHWYVDGTAERAVAYGNRIALHAKNSLDYFAEIGFDSTGIIPKQPYDMEAMAERLYPGQKELKPCGMGLRIEMLVPNQAGNLTNFAHLVQTNYPYDVPLLEEIHRRIADIARSCSDPQTAAAASKALAAKLDELYPFETEHEKRITLKKPSRQPKSVSATHFRFDYSYEMMTHSGRLVEAHHEFRVNVTNDGFKLVIDDLVSYNKDRKSEGGRRLAFAKYKQGLKLSRLAANVIATLTDQQKESLFGGGVTTFRSDDIAYDLQVKKLEVVTSVSFPGVIVKDKSVQVITPVPDSVADSLIGESVRRILEHPLLTDNMIITKVATVLGSTMFSYKAPSVFFKE